MLVKGNPNTFGLIQELGSKDDLHYGVNNRLVNGELYLSIIDVSIYRPRSFCTVFFKGYRTFKKKIKIIHSSN